MPTALTPTPTDGSLLLSLQEGRADAAEHLFRRYAERVRGVARAKLSRALLRLIDADDVVQSVFRRFFPAAREGRYQLAAGETLWDLLLVMTLNLLRSEELFHRAHKRDLRQTVEWRDAGAAEPDRGRIADDDPLQEIAVHDALHRLPHDYREVVQLRLDGYEVAEIAARTDRSKRSVERMLHESRTRLRSLLHLET